MKYTTVAENRDQSLSMVLGAVRFLVATLCRIRESGGLRVTLVSPHKGMRHDEALQKQNWRAENKDYVMRHHVAECSAVGSNPI